MDKDGTNLHEVIETHDAAHRIVCAIEDRPYDAPAERRKLTVLVEALRRGEPVEDTLAEGRLPENIHQRLAAAVLDETCTALPPGIHQRLAEAMGMGGPTVSQDIYERLARAI